MLCPTCFSGSLMSEFWEDNDSLDLGTQATEKLCVICKKHGNRIPEILMWRVRHVQLYSRKRVEWFFKLVTDKFQYWEYCPTLDSILFSQEVAGRRGSHGIEAVRICTQLYCPENAKDVWIGCDSAISRTFWLWLIFFSVLKNMNWIWQGRLSMEKANPKYIWPQNWEQLNEEEDCMVKFKLSNKWCWILSIIACESLFCL